MKKSTNTFMKCVAKTLKRKSYGSHSSIDELTRQLEQVSIEFSTTANVIVNEMKTKIKENDVLYFLNLTNHYAKGRLITLNSTSINLDIEFFYILGKYASPSIYTLLSNSGMIDIFNTSIRKHEVNLYILEGIASSDNNHLLVHMFNLNEFKSITYNDISQHVMSVIEHKAYNTMTSLIDLISNCGSQELKNEFILTSKRNMSHVLEQYDSRMISIIMKGLQKLTK